MCRQVKLVSVCHLVLAALIAFGPGVSVSAPAAQSAAEPLQVRGHFEQGGIIFGRARAGEEVWVDGKQLRLTDKGDFVFGLDRDAPSDLTIKLVDRDGSTRLMHYRVGQRQYKIQRIEGVEQKHVSPPAEVLARISAEAVKVREARTLDDARKDFLQEFVWPLKGPITGVYGSQRVYNGTPKAPHYGLDIAAPVGAVVTAPSAGVVTLAEEDLYFSGGTLILDHGHGLSSTFIHLSKLLVKVGQRIEQGEPIAEVGATGRVTGPHLDWRMNWFDVRVDPQLLMQNKAM